MGGHGHDASSAAKRKEDTRLHPVWARATERPARSGKAAAEGGRDRRLLEGVAKTQVT
jgi:hypothetical protein